MYKATPSVNGCDEMRKLGDDIQVGREVRKKRSSRGYGTIKYSWKWSLGTDSAFRIIRSDSRPSLPNWVILRDTNTKVWMVLAEEVVKTGFRLIW